MREGCEVLFFCTFLFGNMKSLGSCPCINPFRTPRRISNLRLMKNKQKHRKVSKKGFYRMAFQISASQNLNQKKKKARFSQLSIISSQVFLNSIYWSVSYPGINLGKKEHCVHISTATKVPTESVGHSLSITSATPNVNERCTTLSKDT